LKDKERERGQIDLKKCLNPLNKTKPRENGKNEQKEKFLAFFGLEIGDGEFPDNNRGKSEMCFGMFD